MVTLKIMSFSFASLLSGREGFILNLHGQGFNRTFNHPESGFTSTITLIAKLNDLEEAGQNVILIGVTFAFIGLD
jgi:hypothetical protein